MKDEFYLQIQNELQSLRGHQDGMDAKLEEIANIVGRIRLDQRVIGRLADKFDD